MSLERRKIFEFGDFRLDVDERTIERIDQQPCQGKLPEKTFQTLLILLQHRGHLVTKDELLAEIWPDAVVEENNLDKRIHHVRQFLGENSGGGKYIETVRRHGYRFVAKVYTVEVSDSWLPDVYRNSGPYVVSDLNKIEHLPVPGGTSNDDVTSQVESITAHDEPELSVGTAELESDPDQDKADVDAENATGVSIAPVSRRFRFAVILTVAALLLFGSLALYLSVPPKTSAKKSLAVLPVKPIGPDRNDLYEIGIAEALIQRLMSASGVVVRPLTSTRKYTEIDQDPIAAGREQKVDFVLAWTYQLADGKIKITAQLINVATGQVEETYQSQKDQKDLAGIFSIQDWIASELGNKLAARFDDRSSASAAKRGTNNEEAYWLYLQAMNLYSRSNPDDTLKAIAFLDRALEIDPNYAVAWAGKALAHRYASNLGQVANVREHYERSMDAVKRALALDPNLAEAYSALCENKLYYEYDFASAETACQKALELNPNSSIAHEMYSRVLAVRGRPGESVAEVKRAIDLDPNSRYNQRNLGNELFFARRYDEAAAQYRRLLEIDPRYFSAYQWLAVTLRMQGKDSEAFECFMRSEELRGADRQTLDGYETAYRSGGWQALWLSVTDRYQGKNGSSYLMAAQDAQSANYDEAFENLEKSYQEHEWGFACLKVDPRLDPLREDPRYFGLIKHINER